jgi:hypothetical protein
MPFDLLRRMFVGPPGARLASRRQFLRTLAIGAASRRTIFNALVAEPNLELRALSFGINTRIVQLKSLPVSLLPGEHVVLMDAHWFQTPMASFRPSDAYLAELDRIFAAAHEANNIVTWPLAFGPRTAIETRSLLRALSA